MQIELANLVLERTNTVGTGTLDLEGAEKGHQSFVAGIGDGNYCHYRLQDGVAWEIGIGLVTAGTPDTLQRISVIASSNGGDPLSLLGGGALVGCVLPGHPDHARSALHVQDHNVIINGDFTIWQRGTSFSSMLSGAYMADRWRYDKAGTTAVNSGSRSDLVPTFAESGHESKYSLLVSCDTADTAVASGDLATISHKLEGFALRHIFKRDSAVGFWVRSNKTGTYCVSFTNEAGEYSYVSEFTVDAVNTWEFKLIPLKWGTHPGGTWDLENGAAMTMSIALMSGSTFQTATTDQWVAGNFKATANQVNFNDSNSNEFRISQARWYRGAAGGLFVPRHPAEELALCQRYFCVLGRGGSGYATSATHVRSSWQFPVQMRTTPTLTLNNTAPTFTTFGGDISGTGADLSSIKIDDKGMNARVSGFSGLTVLDPFLPASDDIIWADAEI